MSHGLLLKQLPQAERDLWLAKVAHEGLSAAALRRELKGSLRRRRISYLVEDARGFRLAPLRYRHDMSQAEKRRMWDALESAMRIMMRGERAAR
jgi:hypothetical protein